MSFTIPAAISAGAGLLGDLFGGGDAEKASQAAMEQERQAVERALGLLSPFQQAGAGFAIPGMEKMLGQDPTDIVNKILGQYQESPAQTFRTQQAQKAMQNQLASAGLSGSGEAIQRTGQLADQFGSQGQEQFLRDVLGQRQQQMGGLESLFQGGLSAAGTGAGLLGQEGQALGGLAGAGILGQGQERSDMFGDLGTLFGGAQKAGLFKHLFG